MSSSGDRHLVRYGLVLIVLLSGGALLLLLWQLGTGARLHPAADALPSFPKQLLAVERLAVWWEAPPAGIRMRACATGPDSNIHPADYLGPQACRDCHPSNYQAWSRHSHRWMNALATPETVRGDFSGQASISYRGGKAVFYQAEGKYFMHLERGALRRTYLVTQTIGSRFFQYYAGRQIAGPEPPDHHFYHRDHVLPFGYWLTAQEWVPVVHIGPEVEDARRPDPFAPPDRGIYYADYAVGCNACHTTFPLGDMLARRPVQMARHAPWPMHWSLQGYLQEARPEALATLAEALAKRGRNMGGEEWRGGGARQFADGLAALAGWEAPRYAVTLGISCEACHLGGRAHVASKGQVPPRFFPQSPYLYVEIQGKELDTGRTHDNVNWVCGRCHTGPRPQFAAGMATWNSVEYDDAHRGSCYSQLRCVDCHNPHRSLGPGWSLPPEREDAICLRCHESYRSATARQQHTHHPPGSAGDHCFECHLPRLNEGLQSVVRTHMIYSPTRADMIEAGQPNACNLCHTDRTLDWTLEYLRRWYGRSYSAEHLARAYPQRDQPAARLWLRSDNPAVRLVAAAALIRARNREALPDLLEALDDSHLINRQFAAWELQQMLGLRLADFGYHFYQDKAERRQPLARLRARLLP
jgi:predicted CXXCH cytochrome family protein